jgi:hypothetical protein
VVAVQRTSSDAKLNPNVDAAFLDGAYRDTKEQSDGDALAFRAGTCRRATWRRCSSAPATG